MISYEEERQLRDQFNLLMTKELTVDVANEAVDIIERMAGSDDEYAHIMEKELWEAALRHSDSPVAKIVLSTRDIEFSRWFA